MQTEGGSAANINSNGSSVAILPGSLIKFESGSLGLNHGSITVATSKEAPNPRRQSYDHANLGYLD